MRKGKSKRKASAAFLNGANSWRTHLAAYREAHPGVSLKLQMKGASKTYKKGSKGGTGSVGSGSVGSGSGVTVKTSKYEVKVQRKRASKKKGTKKRAGSKKRSKKRSSSFW